MQLGSDEAEHRFLTAAGACVECRLVGGVNRKELQLFGNRAGLLSLTNILLWFVANAWRREMLSLGEIAFMRLELPLAVCVRLSDSIDPNSGGTIRRLDQSSSLEWALSEELVTKIALSMHRLVAMPEHEYDRFAVEGDGAREIHIRMTDAADWIQPQSARSSG